MLTVLNQLSKAGEEGSGRFWGVDEDLEVCGGSGFALSPSCEFNYSTRPDKHLTERKTSRVGFRKNAKIPMPTEPGVQKCC